MTSRRDCTCPEARHEHGTYLSYNADHCRCEACTTAKRERQRACRRAHHQATWGGTPLLLDATGARRRLQALAAIGWSLRTIGIELGMSARAVMFIRDEYRRIHPDLNARVAALYEQLWDRPQYGQGPTLARKHAAARGWPPPMAWDDDDIDYADINEPRDDSTPQSVDEIAVAEAVAGRPVALTRAEMSAAVATLQGMGYSAKKSAERLRTTSRTVQRRQAGNRKDAA